MGEAGLHTRLSCTCQVCITWRRCGILLENCHQDTPYFQLALRALRQCASELLDHRSEGCRCATSRGSGRLPATRSSQKRGSWSRGTSRSGWDGARGEARRRREDSRFQRREEEEVQEEKEAQAEPEETSPKEAGEASAKKDKSGKDRSRGRKRKRKIRSRSRSRRRRSSEPIRPSQKVRRSASPERKAEEKEAASQPAKKDPILEDGPERPPGFWRLREVPGSTPAPSLPSRPRGSERPPEPIGPPPHWQQHQPDTAPQTTKPKNRGKVRRERARDINQHGFSVARKQLRIARGRE